MPRPISQRDFKSFIGMMFGSALSGFAIAILAALIGSKVLEGNSFGGFGGLVGVLAGMMIGYPIGVAVGILVFSKVFNYQGSLWLAALGAVTGIFLILGLAEPLNLNSNSNLMLWSAIVLTSLLATWGFHLGKRGGSQGK